MNKKLMTMGLAALMLAGCSSDDIVSDGGQGGAGKGTAYVGLKLQLPSVKGSQGSRATEFEVATSDENKVSNLTVVFLDKTSNKVKQVVGIDGTQLFWTDDKGTGIGTVAETPVIKVDFKDACNMLVLVNNKLSETDSIVTFTKEEEPALFPNTPLTVDMTKLISTQGFFMSSAVLKGEGNTASYFVNVTPQATEAAAQAAASDNVVYVERAVAKVKVNAWNNWTYTINYDGAAEDFKNSTVKITNWNLDVTNKNFYPVRKFTDSWLSLDSRFFENTYTPTRVYWSETPGYANYDADNYTVLTNMTTTEDLNAAQYCPENTFQVKNMQHRQTTRVLFQATYTPNKVMKVQTDGNYTLTTTTVTEGTTWYRVGNSSDAWLHDDLCAYIKSILGYEVTLTNVQAGKHAFASSNTEGTVNNVLKKDGESKVLGGDLDKLNKALGQLTTFVNGVCYYQTRIRHFNDEQTPWKNNFNYITGSSTTLDKDYLGRYGVVRNNYYELTLNKVAAPGAPTIDELKPGEDPDDVQNYYIQATIKILDWAKRTQDVNL